MATRERWQERARRYFTPVEATDCWVWQGGITGRGYGAFWRDGATISAHRVVYEMLVGPIPEGMTLDHLCRNRACVNPSHLDPVPMAENLRRSPIAPSTINAGKTHCNRGHAYDEANTRLYEGRRWCRACARERYYRNKGRG